MLAIVNYSCSQRPRNHHKKSLFRKSFQPHFFLLQIQVNPANIQFFEENGFHFVGQDIDGERMEIVELDGK